MCVAVVCNLLMSTLERVTDKGEAGRIIRDEGTLSLKHLPAIVKGTKQLGFKTIAFQVLRRVAQSS